MVIDFEAVKKELVENTKDYITAEMKEKAVAYFRDTVLSNAEQVGNSIIDALHKQAEEKSEKGWLWFRDSILFPGVIRVSLTLLKLLVDKVEEVTKKEMETAAAPATPAETEQGLTAQ